MSAADRSARGVMHAGSGEHGGHGEHAGSYAGRRGGQASMLYAILPSPIAERRVMLRSSGRKAGVVGPEHAAEAVIRARELVLAKSYKPAAVLLREHLAAHPTDSIAWHRLAGALLGCKDRDGAIAAADRSINLDPENPVAYRMRALAILPRAGFRGAYPDAVRAVDLGPENDESLSLLACAVLTVDRDEARFNALIRRAAELNPNSRAAQRAGRLFRRRRANAVLISALMAACAVLTVLVLTWFAADIGQFDDAGEMSVSILIVTVGVGVGFVLLRLRSAAFLVIGITHAVAAAIAAGIVTTGVTFGATGNLTLSGAFGLGAALMTIFMVIRVRGVLRRRGF